jgi:hypothetical protein
LRMCRVVKCAKIDRNNGQWKDDAGSAGDVREKGELDLSIAWSVINGWSDGRFSITMKMRSTIIWHVCGLHGQLQGHGESGMQM